MSGCAHLVNITPLSSLSALVTLSTELMRSREPGPACHVHSTAATMSQVLPLSYQHEGIAVCSAVQQILSLRAVDTEIHIHYFQDSD